MPTVFEIRSTIDNAIENFAVTVDPAEIANDLLETAAVENWSVTMLYEQLVESLVDEFKRSLSQQFGVV